MCIGLEIAIQNIFSLKLSFLDEMLALCKNEIKLNF